MPTRMLGRILVMTTAIAATANAQLVNGKWQAPAKPSGTATAPRQGVQAQQPETKKPTSSGGVVLTPLRVIQAIVMTDGSIWADFGFGLEQVSRSCPSGASTMPLQVIGVSQLPDPRVAPPILTAQQKAVSKEAAQASCLVRDGGRIFATR
jgi:hypothetical protein